MKAGLYYANSKQYGRYWPEVKGFCQVYADWEPGTRWPILAGKFIWVDLNLPDDKDEHLIVVDHLRALKKQWPRIIALQVRDEPSWTKAELNKITRYVKDRVREAGLPARPVGATFSVKQILGGVAWQAPELDWVGPEFYLKRQPGDNVQTIPGRMRQEIQKLLARIGPVRKLIPTIQAYDQRKTEDADTRLWNEQELVAMQQPAISAARALGPRVICALFFAYARPGGVRAYPALKTEIKRQLAGAA